MPLAAPTPSCRVAEGRLQILQIHRLLQCVHDGDTAQIEKMVKLGVENLINLTEPQDGNGVLHSAVLDNSSELVSFLLSQGADPNCQDKKGRTPLMLAAELANPALVSLLAQCNADLRIQDAEGRGVLFYCIGPSKRNILCLQAALECQADPNNVSVSGLPVFLLMCEYAHECTPMCLLMLEAGADPNATNKYTGVTALMEAAKEGSLPLVRAILKRGGNPNTLDRKRLSAVQYAAMGGFLEVIQALSAYSADMSTINLDMGTALHFAAATGDALCCRFLAQRGCNAKLKNQEGILARQIAKDAGHKAALKELKKGEKQFGKNKDTGGDGPMTVLWALRLHDWSSEHEEELMEALRDEWEMVPKAAFVSALQELKAPSDEDQLLRVLAQHDKQRSGRINMNDFIKGVKYVKKPFLLSSYLPKKKKDKKGGKKKKGKFVLPMPICTLTPDLMPRREDGGPPRFLVESYISSLDPRRFDDVCPPQHPVMNDSGWYIDKPKKVYVNINYCVKSGDLASLDLAFSQGVLVDVQDEFYKTPLMVACATGNSEVAQYLINRGADVGMQDQFFWTPLHHAAHAGHVDIIEMLMEVGAKIDALALSGGTPLMKAIQGSQPSCVHYLIEAGADVTAMNKKEQTCLDIAEAFGDYRVIQLVRDKLETLPKPKEGKGKGGKGAKAKDKVVPVAESSVNAESSTATAGQKSLDSNSVILHNARITAGNINTMDSTFVPKSIWGKPPTTRQLMSQLERRKELLSLEMDFDDLMLPFNHKLHAKDLERGKILGLDRK